MATVVAGPAGKQVLIEYEETQRDGTKKLVRVWARKLRPRYAALVYGLDESTLRKAGIKRERVGPSKRTVVYDVDELERHFADGRTPDVALEQAG